MLKKRSAIWNPALVPGAMRTFSTTPWFSSLFSWDETLLTSMRKRPARSPAVTGSQLTASPVDHLLGLGRQLFEAGLVKGCALVEQALQVGTHVAVRTLGEDTEQEYDGPGVTARQVVQGLDARGLLLDEPGNPGLVGDARQVAEQLSGLVQAQAFQLVDLEKVVEGAVAFVGGLKHARAGPDEQEARLGGQQLADLPVGVLEAVEHNIDVVDQKDETLAQPFCHLR